MKNIPLSNTFLRFTSNLVPSKISTSPKFRITAMITYGDPFVHSYLPSSNATLSWRNITILAIFLSVHLFSRKYHSSASSNWSRGYRISEKKKKTKKIPIRRTISTRVAWSICGGGVLTWRDWSVDGAKSEGKEMRIDGQTDGQTGGQKVKCPRRRIKWRFRIRPLSSVRPSGRWKRWKGRPPPFGQLSQDLHV